MVMERVLKRSTRKERMTPAPWWALHDAGRPRNEWLRKDLLIFFSLIDLKIEVGQEERMTLRKRIDKDLPSCSNVRILLLQKPFLLSLGHLRTNVPLHVQQHV